LNDVAPSSRTAPEQTPKISHCFCPDSPVGLKPNVQSSNCLRTTTYDRKT